MEQLQLSLFAPPTEGAVAVCCGDGKACPAAPLEPWMLAIEPNGHYVVMVGTHHFVLSPTKAEERDGQLFYLYRIGGKLYSGIFVERGK